MAEVDGQVNVFEGVSDQGTADNPFEQANIPAGDAASRNIRSIQGAVIAADRGENPVDAYVTIDQVEPGIADTVLRERVIGRQLEATEQAVTGMIEDGEEVDIDAARQVVMEDRARLDEGDVLANSRAFVMSLEGTAGLSNEAIDDIAAKWYMMQQAGQIADESGWLQKGTDLAGAIALADESYNIIATLDKLGVANMTNYLSSAEYFLKFRQAMDLLPPEQRVGVFNAFRKAYAQVDDNEFQQMMALMEIAGDLSADSIEFFQAADKLGAFLTATGIGKLGVGAMKTFNVLQAASKATKASANIVDIAARSPELARVIGVSQIDAAASIDPTVDVLKGTILKGAPIDIQTNITKQFDEVDAVLREQSRIDQIGLRLTDSERAVAEAKIVNKIQGQPGVNNLQVLETTDAGVTISLDYSTTAKQIVTSAPPPPKPAAAPSGGSTGLSGIGQGMAGSISENLRSRLWLEYQGRATLIDNLSTRARTEVPGLSRRDFITWAEMEVAQRGSGTAWVQAGKPKLAPAAPPISTPSVSAPAQPQVQIVPTTVRIKSTVPFTIDDITGGFNRSTLTNVGDSLKLAASPNFLFKADRERLVQAFERATFGGARITEGLNRSMESALSGLSRSEKKRLQDILLEGDSRSIDFSYDDLVGAGRLSEKEFAAYAKVRHVVNKVHSLKNKDVVDSFRARGVKEFSVAGQAKLFGKDYDSVDSAVSAYASAQKQSGNKWVFVNDPLNNNPEIIKDLTREALEEYYNAGYRLVRGQDAIELPGTAVRWAMVKGDGIRQVNGLVLQRKAGYIPRMYKDSFFFVKEARKINVDGVAGGGTKLVTHRYFDNFADAQTYKAQLIARAKERGDDIDEDTFRVLGDREITSSELEGDLLNIFGGPFGGHRAEEAIPFGLDGVEGARIDPFEAIQKYFNHIGNRMPLSQYRLAIQQRWLNSAKQAKLLPVDYTGDFFSAQSEILKSKGRVSEDLLNFHLKSHDQIKFNLRIPSSEEQALQAKVRDIGKSLEESMPRGLKGISKWVYRMDNTRPADAIRGATFNLLLGIYNPAQYFVQMLGATVALSINPVHALAGLPKFFAFKLLDNIQNPVAKGKAIEMLAKDNTLSGIGEAYLLWDRAGMRESVLLANADYNSFAKGLPYGAGALRRAAANHTFFFKAGELDNMRLSFTTSYQKWRAENPEAIADAKALDKIVARAENYRLNMSSANKAAFQRGWTSVPLQFQQVQTKFLESILGNTFTKTERTKLLLGQAALFGAAGVPFVDALYPYVMDQMGVDPSQMTEEELIAHRRGFVGWLFNDYFDVNAVVTGRVAIAAGFAESIVAGVTDWTTLPEALLGPSFTSGDRVLRSLQTFTDSVRIVVNAEDLSTSDVASASGALAYSLAQIPSSTANMIRAYDFANSGMYRNKSGVAAFPLQDLNTQTIWAQALGFSLQEVHDMYELGTSIKAERTAKNAAADRLVSLMHKMITVGEDETRAYQLAASAILSSFSNPEDKNAILKSVENKLKTPEDKQAKEVMRIVESWGSELQSAAERFNTITVRALEQARNNQ